MSIVHEARVKANELLDQHMSIISEYPSENYSERIEHDTAKKAALITVDNILDNIEATILYHKDNKALSINKEYWTGVKDVLNNF